MMEPLKVLVTNAIDESASDLHSVCHEIWKHPELNHEEYFAHNILCNLLEKEGFTVTRNYIIDTAFRAVFGDTERGPCVAFLCEYDALPEIGHACGHNLIAEVGLAAGLGIKRALQTSGVQFGQVVVLGTPAEEGGGGKIDLINGGAFNDIDIVLMAHPSSFNVAQTDSQILQRLSVKYAGKAAHSAGAPWDGVNALDAAVTCYQSVACLRQQFKPNWRVHGIISNGGARPNIIPEIAELEFYIRTLSLPDLVILKEKVLKCIEGSASVTGCEVETVFDDKPYLNVLNNNTLCTRYQINAEELGVDFSINVDMIPPTTGSTDMGNVSHEVPGIHPEFYIGSNCVYHTREYTAAAGDDTAQPYTITQGKVLALTALDIYTRPDLLKQAKRDFKADLVSA